MIIKQKQEGLIQINSLSARSNEVSSIINQLNRLLIQFWLLQSFLSLFSDPFPLQYPLSFILRLFFHLYSTRGQLMAYADPCLISLFQISLGVAIRLTKYYSKITYSLMRPESLLQSIQCSDSSFPLDIFEFPSFLYICEAHPYHWSFLEGHRDYYDTHLSCA